MAQPLLKDSHHHHQQQKQQTLQILRRLVPVFLLKCSMQSYTKNFGGFEDFGRSQRQEQKPMCSVFTGFNCFGFKLSSKMFLPNERPSAWDVFCFASVRRLKKRPWFVSVRHHFSVRENMPLETIKGLQCIVRVKNRLQCVFRMVFFFF